jgi:hypothetical protein
MADTKPLSDRVPGYVDRNEEMIKRAMKEAIKEWLDDQFKIVGKWTVRGFLAAALSGLVYFLVHFGGAK